MAQNTVLAAGTTAATSTDTVVAAGASVTVGIFPSTAGVLPSDVAFVVSVDTPGIDRVAGKLDQNNPVLVVSGPCTFRVRRPAYTGHAFGVFTET